MKTIVLSNGLEAMVDDADHERLSLWQWHAVRKRSTWYVYRNAVMQDGVRGTHVAMHRDVDGTPEGLETDHIDGNGLNNQRSNLRPCTHQQNMQNRRKRASASSAFKGVTWDKKKGKWKAQIAIGPMRPAGCRASRCLGLFVSEEDAARAYDAAAKKHFGEFAYTNFGGANG